MSRLRKIITTVTLAWTLLAFPGCMTVGRDFPVEYVSQIQIGKTTQMDIQRMFGPPWRTGLENGKVTWTYGKYRYTVTGGAHTSDLVIRFDENNVVESWTFNAD